MRASVAPSAFRIRPLFRLFILLLLAGLVLPVLFSPPTTAGQECHPLEAVTAVMDEIAAEKTLPRWSLRGARAVMAAQIISAVASHPTPKVDTVQALQNRDVVIVAFAYQGQVCSPYHYIAPILWRRVLQTASKAA
jgi:hypothetical protein